MQKDRVILKKKSVPEFKPGVINSIWGFVSENYSQGVTE